MFMGRLVLRRSIWSIAVTSDGCYRPRPHPSFNFSAKVRPCCVRMLSSRRRDLRGSAKNGERWPSSIWFQSQPRNNGISFLSGGKRDETLILPLHDSVSLTISSEQVRIMVSKVVKRVKWRPSSFRSIRPNNLRVYHMRASASIKQERQNYLAVFIKWKTNLSRLKITGSLWKTFTAVHLRKSIPNNFINI